MSIATKLALLANTKENLRVSLGLSKDVPFSQYAGNVPWTGDVIPATGTVFDFQKNRYAKDGKAVYLDYISEFIRLSSATKWQNGQLVEVQNDIPRISEEGLLNEEQRTNLVPYSDVSAGKWAHGGNHTTGVATGMPGILATGVRLVHNGEGPATYNYYQQLEPIPEVTHTLSLFIRYEDGRDIVGEFGAPGSEGSSLNPFTIVINGRAMSLSALKIQAVGGGVLRLSASITPSDTVMRGWGLLIRPQHKEGLPPLYVTGYQIEVGSFPSSYIPTNGTPATRAPDILNIPLLPTQSLTGDWDAGVTYSVAGGTATFTGHGYIRNITVEEEDAPL